MSAHNRGLFLAAPGFASIKVEPLDEALVQRAAQIRMKLLGAEIMVAEWWYGGGLESHRRNNGSRFPWRYVERSTTRGPRRVPGCLCALSAGRAEFLRPGCSAHHCGTEPSTPSTYQLIAISCSRVSAVPGPNFIAPALSLRGPTKGISFPSMMARFFASNSR